MAEPFLGEIRIMSFGYAPKDWAMCNGQLLPINQNQALFSLLGTMYGGDGRVNFALPDLRSRVPIHMGAGFTQGQRAGEEFHNVTMSEMPTHLHVVSAQTANGTTVIPTGNSFASFLNGYRSPDNLAALPAQTVTNVGGSQPHENRQPYLALNACIALVGIFPSQN